MGIKTPKIRNWRDCDNLDRLLFFAQSLEEKLFDYTIDSYKARALNIHTILYELSAVCSKVVEARLNTGVLIPLIEEFKDQVVTDPVIGDKERHHFKVYVERLENLRSKPNELLDLIEAMLIEIEGYYWDKLKDLISKEVRGKSNSRLIATLADLFISEAELQGFHRSYVYHITKKSFWRSKISSIEVIDEFLSLFSNGSKDYIFLLKATTDFLQMKDFAASFAMEISKQAPNLDFGHNQASKFIDDNEEYPIFVTIKVEAAQNPVNARIYAERQMEALANVFSFHVHHVEPSWYSVALCLNQENQFEGFLKAPMPPIKRCRHSTVNNKKEAIKKTIELLSGRHFYRDDLKLFFKALDYHRAALTAETPENQLVDLWAALEAFLPVPDADGSRITHYVSTLSPCLTLSYSDKLFSDLEESFLNDNVKLVEFVQKCFPGKSFKEALVCLIVAEEQEENRSELYKMIGCNPLLRHRCFTLNEKFSSNKKVYKTLIEHKQRVSWHMQRIYTTRNQIVHDAESLPYLTTLVENLHFYIDALINSVSIIGAKSKSKCTANGAIRLLSISEQSWLCQLKSQSEIRCNESNFLTIVYGQCNPLSQYNSAFSVQ